MKMRVYLMLILVLVFSSCVRNKKGQTVQIQTTENSKVFEVTDVIQGNTYTYMNVKENMAEKWVATSKTEANPGDVLYYDEALQMNNFHSKELDRTFDVIYFINQVSKTPIQNNMMGGGMPPHSGKVETEERSNISLQKSDNEISIAQIFANPDDYVGKDIEIRGIVVKVNNEIMGKNWVHIQDGSNNNGQFDLTVTTADRVKVDDEVIFRGKVSLEKDFGAGYYYDVIMEEAELLNPSKGNTQM